jgi:hypothetical protein
VSSASDVRAPAGCAATEVRPLIFSGRRALVDGHPICAVCGTAAVPVGPDRWRHARAGASYPSGSRWLRPVTPASVRRLGSFAEFTARYPDVVRPPSGSPLTEEHWRCGRERLLAYGRKRNAAPGRNPLLELVSLLAGVAGAGPGPIAVTEPLARMLDVEGRRRELSSRYAWAIPSEAALGLIGDHGPVVEAGAGTGYWASLLRDRGAEVWATDLSPGANRFHRAGRTWLPVTPMAAVDAARQAGERTLLLCWPPPDDDAAGYAAVRAYRGGTVITVGGGPDGPTGTARLHRELDLNWSVSDELALPSWPGIPDRVTVWRRNPARRPLRLRDRCPSCARFVGTGSPERCPRCVAAAPPALALRQGRLRVEYPADVLASLPAALRTALFASRHRLPVGGR